MTDSSIARITGVFGVPAFCSHRRSSLCGSSAATRLSTTRGDDAAPV